MKEAKYQAKIKELASRTGIDFTKYRDPVLVEKIGNMLTIQICAFKSISIPIMVLFALHAIVAVYAFTVSKIAVGIGIGLLGVIPSIIVGLLVGLVVLMSTVKDNVQQIFGLSLDTIKTIVSDINTGFQSKLNGTQDKIVNIPKLADLLQGVVFGVVLPSVRQIIVSKFSLLRIPLEYIFNSTIEASTNYAIAYINKISDIVPDKQSAIVSKIAEKTSTVIVQSDSIHEKMIHYIDETSKFIDTRIESIAAKVITPIKLVMIIGLLLIITVLTICIKSII
jgi:hypothetical protein